MPTPQPPDPPASHLPILNELRPHPHRHASRVETWGVRLYRLVLIGCAAWLIHVADRVPVVQDQPTALDENSPLLPAVELGDARRLFPDAVLLGPIDPGNHRHAALNEMGETLGFVLRTAPETDDLIGYAGPSDLLIGLSATGDVVKVLLNDSADTVSHVDAIRADREFWKQFIGWQPGSEPFPPIDAVSGSTLTSLAMAEGVQRRLTGAATSLRFPEVVTLAEVQQFFPAAVSLKSDMPRSGWSQAIDAVGEVMGYVVRTSPATDNVIGYQGPTECLFSVSPDQQTILAVRIRKSFETPDYVKRIERDTAFFELLAGRTIADYRELDFQAAGIEGVSGATQTSFAIADGVRRRLKLDQTLSDNQPVRSRTVITFREIALIAVIAGSVLMTFWPRLRGRLPRRLWQVIVVLVFGVWLGDLLSISLFAGWSRHGVPLTTAPYLLALAVISLVTPWLTRQQIYCHQVCPHGAVQEWLGRFRRWQWHLPVWLSRTLSLVPMSLLAAAFVFAVVQPDFDLTQLEPFDAWSLGTLAMVSFCLAVVGLVVSLFVPQAYCRYGCPTGALLKFVRSHGTQERFGRQEVLATLLMAGVALWQYPLRERLLSPVTPNSMSQSNISQQLPPPAYTGSAFGTIWSVRVRPGTKVSADVSEQLSQELERVERTLSHWKPESETSLFNSSDTTLELEFSAELIGLVVTAQEISRATSGHYDITVAPLVDLWGYGPSRRSTPPGDREIASVLEQIGWQKLHVDPEFLTLRKDHPKLQMDLGSCLQGYAADRLAELLTTAGIEEFLIDVGGELRARGAWRVAIEDPRQPSRSLTGFTLQDAALATSGTYRHGELGELTTRHILSPLTGQPVASNVVLCAVIAPLARDADAWATAYLSMPESESRSLAEQRQDAVLLVKSDGSIHKSSRWPGQ